MSVQNILSASGTSSTSMDSTFQTVNNAFKALSTALQQGNLTAAQQAFATIEANAPQGSSSTSSSSTSSASGASGSSQMSSDFSALSSALQSGNLTAAKEAFATIQKHMESHKPKGGGFDGSNASVQGTDTDAISESDLSSGSTLSVTA